MAKFIAIEGLDGSGKGTQSEILADRLTKLGYRVGVMSFPDYQSEGSVPVRMYLGGELGSSPSDVNAYAASLLFCTDRLVSWKTVWEKKFGECDIVIANRYTTANAYHQLSKLPREEWDGFLEWMYDLEFNKVRIPEPDRVICLLNPPESSIAMIEKRCLETGVKKDIHEADADYLGRCYEAAVYAGERFGWTMISCVDGERNMISRENMHVMIMDAIGDILP